MKIEINNNLISVDNYKQIKQIENDLIVLQNVKIIGKSLNIKHLDQHLIVVEGIINNITLGEWDNELQNKNEEG
ncbi:MAG: hypothetical protein IJY14_01440 [Acholeplasmatales bacterium]|nr:hypothetical protein [Acholeplasmatales bacterium]